MSSPSETRLLLGDEAVACAARDAGITAAYGYPGTPSTEILEALRAQAAQGGRPIAEWCANEKTAYETALGTSMVGRRALVTMKHVGLNVAADPFMSSALVAIRGGLVLAVADDPGMHSSQNEQDSRMYADFARIVCFEPADQQQAYDMTREAFDVSERFHVPVMVRLVTRLAHSRAAVALAPPVEEKPLARGFDPPSWTLLPVNARRRFHHVLDLQKELRALSESSPHNRLELSSRERGLGVITTGLGRNYYLENAAELSQRPSHLHIGLYPIPERLVRELVAHVSTVVIIEEGYPLVERLLRGILPPALEVRGKLSGEIPLDGELTPEAARRALGLPPHVSSVAGQAAAFDLPPRPPQLCQGCPHRDAFEALHRALEGMSAPLVTSDIGCYTLGVLPPISMGVSCVSMGASIGMAKGAAEAGYRPVVAVIGDGTFYHSGMSPLCDAIAADTDMTVLILDNGTIGMTGGQPTVLPSERLRDVTLGLGAHLGHVQVIDSHPRKADAMAAVLRREIEHPGLSVVIAHRECIEVVRRRKKETGQ